MAKIKCLNPIADCGMNLFSDKFTIKTLEKAHNSIKPRQNKELFFIFEVK